MTLRLRILEYIEKKENAGENAHLFQLSEKLNLRLDVLARELKVLIDKGCLIAYKGGIFELTPEGKRELRQLKGEYSSPSYHLGK